MLFKFLSKLFICIVILSLITQNIFVFAETNNYESVVIQKIKILKTINILPDDFDTTKPVTRAEFTKYIVSLCNLSVSPSDTRYFKDVEATNPYFSYISALAICGFITFGDKFLFRPNDSITLAEATKILVTAIGYNVYAENNGGFPSGYINEANNTGITKAVNIKNVSSPMGEEIAYMFYNTLFVPLLEIEQLGEKVTYSSDENITLLWEKHKVVEIKGIVTANDITSINSENGVIDGNVRIGDDTYIKGDTSANTFLSLNVRAFARVDEDSDKKTILYIEKSKQNDGYIKIGSNDIADETTKDNFFYNNANDKLSKALKISKDASVIYNGIYKCKIINITNEELRFEDASTDKKLSGDISLCDLDGDDYYDVVIINKYDTYVVGTVDKTNKIIVDKQSNRYLELDIDNDDYKFNIVKGDKNITFDDIAIWDVLSVATSENASYINVIVAQNMIEGTLESLNDEYAIIDGKEVDFSNHFIKLWKGNELKFTFKAGITGAFLVDAFGEIAGVDTKEDITYAYLMGIEKAKAFDNPKIKIFEMNGQIAVYSLADKVKLNDDSIAAEEAVSDAKLFNTNKNIAIHQLIKIQFDSSMNVKEIITAIDSTTNSLGYNEQKFSLDFKRKSTFKLPGIFDNSYLTSGGILLYVPLYNADSAKAIDDKEIIKKDFNSIVSDSYLDIEVYDADSNRIPSVVIVRETASYTVDLSSNFFIVEKVLDRLDDSTGDTIKVISGTQKGVKIDLKVDFDIVLKHITYWHDQTLTDTENDARKTITDLLISDIKPGDIVQYTVKGKGNVDYIERLFSYGSSQPQYFVSSYPNYSRGRGHERLFGFVNTISKTSGGLLFNDRDNEEFARVLPFVVSPAVYIYNVVNKTVTVGSLKDILDMKNSGSKSSKIFIRSRFNILSEIFVYKY